MSSLLVGVIFAEGLCYPMALGFISSIGGLYTKCTSLRQRILKNGLIGFSWEHQKILLNQPVIFSVH